MPKAGFSFMEILIVIVIVGILSTLAIYNYSGIQEHAIGREAQANLKLIAAAEKIYHMETGSYYGPESSMSAINDWLKLQLPVSSTSKKWDYAITSVNNAVSPATFSAQAQRTTGDCVRSIDQGQEEPIVVSGTCP